MNADIQAKGFRMETAMVLLKQQLILQRLNETSESERHYRIITEAEAASAVVAETGLPWLFFPCVFEERLAAADSLVARSARSVRFQSIQALPARELQRTFQYSSRPARPMGPGSYLVLLHERRRNASAGLHSMALSRMAAAQP